MSTHFIRTTIMRGLIVALALLSIQHEAQASCGSANCFLVTGTQEGIAAPSQIILDLSYRWIPMDRFQRGSDKIGTQPLVPTVDFEDGTIRSNGHREYRTNNELGQLDATFGITPRFALTVAVPFFNHRSHEHADVHADEHHNEPQNFSRQDGTSGFGDVRLTGKYAFLIRTKHLLVGGLGIKIPSGEYKLLDHEGKINEPTLQPGTGSWDGLLSTYYSYEMLPHRLNLFGSGLYQVTTKNGLDYKMGNTLTLNGGINYLTMGERPKTLSLQINARLAHRDLFRGQGVPSTGGTWVYLTPGAMVQASPNGTLYAHVQIPIYQYVNEENLVPRYGLIIGWSHHF